MNKLFIILAAAALMTGCRNMHNDSTGGTANDRMNSSGTYQSERSTSSSSTTTSDQNRSSSDQNKSSDQSK